MAKVERSSYPVKKFMVSRPRVKPFTSDRLVMEITICGQGWTPNTPKRNDIATPRHTRQLR